MDIPTACTTLSYNLARLAPREEKKLPRGRGEKRGGVQYEVKVHFFHVNVSPPLTLAPSSRDLWSNRRHFLSRWNVSATRGQSCHSFSSRFLRLFFFLLFPFFSFLFFFFFFFAATSAVVETGKEKKKGLFARSKRAMHSLHHQNVTRPSRPRLVVSRSSRSDGSKKRTRAYEGG